jgi:hypothetical protein
MANTEETRPTPIVIDFLGEPTGLYVTVGEYDSGATYVGAVEADAGEPFCDVTVNLGGMPDVDPAMAFINTNDCPKALRECLMDLGLYRPTGIEEKSGFCTYPLVWLDLEAMGPYLIRNEVL